ncbi:MAG TPA: UDP-N-acetylmuramoyl-tripeptide--D-alanyl-D-alanine ligase [Pirellulales bacterium]|nr:UDP-N-acetylmuramoyl-tripeptide--D-alanyl-D-alanine ligase [Pirellulales bacterium]
MLLTLGQLREITGGQLRLAAMPPRHGETTHVGPIATDSRRVQAEMVFWGLKGPRFDGSCFAEDALVRGAAGVVVAGRDVEPWAGRWSLRVEDGLKALWSLAAWKRQQFSGRVLAVTGSVGKTTTRLMIDTVLHSKFPGTTSPHNYNNDIGVPLSLLRLEQTHHYAALELGASGPGEIGKLAELCRPQIGIITRIGEAHLAGFGNQQQLATAKAELLAALPKDGLAVLNGDDPWLRTMASRTAARIVWTGRGVDCDLTAVEVRASGGRLQFRVDGQRYHVAVWGRHHLTSALAAIAVGLEFGLSPAEISDALAGFQPPSMRCQVTDAAGVKVIDDSYNASPAAMRAALELLREVDAPGERVVVCGDMKELGTESQQWHRRIGEEVVTRCGADRLIAYGDHADDVVVAARAAGMPRARATACQAVEETISLTKHATQPGSAVLVKGSRAMGLERVVEAIRNENLRRAA